MAKEKNVLKKMRQTWATSPKSCSAESNLVQGFWEEGETSRGGAPGRVVNKKKKTNNGEGQLVLRNVPPQPVPVVRGKKPGV